MLEFILAFDVLLVLLSIMIIVGIFKNTGIVERIVGGLLLKISNKPLFISIASMLSGVLPVHNRVILTSAMLDAIREKNKDAKALGIISYIATHHYYLWSPLEKTVLISMSVLGITYAAFLKMMALPILACFVLSGFFIYQVSKIYEINLISNRSRTKARFLDYLDFGLFLSLIGLCIFVPKMPIIFASFALYLIIRYRQPFRTLQSYINWKTLGIVTGVVGFGLLVKTYQSALMALVTTMTGYPFAAVMAVAFVVAFILGSSSKFATLSATLSLGVGIKYFPILFIIEYCAYLLSPTHKCVLIGSSYFKTPLYDYYKIIGAFSVLLIALTAITLLL